jgi:hypothetical protein
MEHIIKLQHKNPLEKIQEFNLKEWSIIEPQGLQECYENYIFYSEIPDENLTQDGKVLKELLLRIWEGD